MLSVKHTTTELFCVIISNIAVVLLNGGVTQFVTVATVDVHTVKS